MSQQKLLIKVITELQVHKIPYMVTGSTISSYQGDPRATHDIDMVVQLKQADIAGLLKGFPEPDFYLNRESMEAAIASKDMFNLIDVRDGDKVDFFMLTTEPYDQARFNRRRFVEIFGSKMAISAPEDTILYKLKWAKQSGGSEKQFYDALRVYELQHGVLDQLYIHTWLGYLGIEDAWQRLLREAKII